MTGRPYLLGLTGSIGMGKSTTADLFRAEGVPVWDADATVHRLYAAGGGAVEAIGTLAPAAVVDHAVDRDRLRAAITADPGLLARIETLVHPLVAADRAGFTRDHADHPILVCDIPLLYETGAERGLDGVLVVTAPADIQRARVLARPGMTEAALDRILARQMPDTEKRRRADFLLETDRGIEPARSAVRALIAKLKGASHA